MSYCAPLRYQIEEASTGLHEFFQATRNPEKHVREQVRQLYKKNNNNNNKGEETTVKGNISLNDI